MKLRTNTNKRIRASINKVLDTFDLTIGNATYRDAHEVIQLGGGNDRIKARLEDLGCMTVTSVAYALNLSSNSQLDAFLSDL